MILAIPKLLYGIVAFFTILFLYLYCRPIGLYCLPCCEDNCSSQGYFTYCINKDSRGNKNSFYCKSINGIKVVLKKLLQAVLVLIKVMRVVIVNILKVVKKVFTIILDIINIIINIGSVALNIVSGNFDMNFDKIVCNMFFIVQSVDMCWLGMGRPLKATFRFIGTLFEKLLSALSAVVKQLAPIFRQTLGPIITFVMDVINFVLTPVIELVQAVITLMKDIVVFFMHFFSQDNPFKYMYWKMIWRLQENFPWVPVETLPLVLAIFVGGQFLGGLVGVYKMALLPLRMANGASRLIT